MRAADEIAKHYKKYKPLSNEEEKQLAVRCLAGDKEAGEKLVRHNMMYALKIASRWARTSEYRVHEDEVVQGAIVGLIKATKRYDGRIRFAIYARRGINWAIEDSVEVYLSHMSLPQRVSGIVPLVKKSLTKLKRTIEIPSVDDIMKDAGLEPRMKHQVSAALHVINDGNRTSLDFEMGEGDYTLHEVLFDDKAVGTSELAEYSSVCDVIDKALALLTPRQEYCIREVFGIGTSGPREGKDVGADIGLTRQGVSFSVRSGLAIMNGECKDRNYSRNKFKFIWDNKEELL